jgi:predicted nucleic acid-binding protein
MNATRGERFSLDSNVLIYAVHREADRRHDIAIEIVDRAIDCDCVLTLQSLAEFYTAVTRKNMASPDAAMAQVHDWMNLFPRQIASDSALKSAIEAAQSGRFRFWDAMLLATAGEAGCATVVSEDMADGARLGGVRVRHPFVEVGGRLDMAPAVKALLKLA